MRDLDAPMACAASTKSRAMIESVEARTSSVDGRRVGSEHANLLAAFAIGGPAGLVVSDLQGRALDQMRIVIDEPQDFVCAASQGLLTEAIAALRENRTRLRALFDEPG